jgi:transposase-like protein
LTSFSFTKAEEIIGKLREAEIVLAQGGTVADACRRISVTEQSYYRWRKEHGANAPLLRRSDWFCSSHRTARLLQMER